MRSGSVIVFLVRLEKRRMTSITVELSKTEGNKASATASETRLERF
jgi:hypothetical protein